MFFLDNVFNDDDVWDFVVWVCCFLKFDLLMGVLVVIVELKIDGLFLLLCYEGGELVYVVICGDGIIGENVIVNVCMIQDIL